MPSTFLVAAEEQTRDLPLPPLVFGVVGFAGLLVLVVAVLMFGKGRPHS